MILKKGEFSVALLFMSDLAQITKMPGIISVRPNNIGQSRLY